MDAVAETVHDITPGWLTRALQGAGHDYTVASVHHRAIGTGQMGCTYRLALDYDGPGGPPTLVVKLAAADESTRRLVSSGYAAEVGFYLHLAPRLQVSTPKCWYGAISEANTEFSLLLDDMTPAMPGVQVDGCTVREATSSIDNLLGLHTPLWNDPTLKQLAFLMQPNEAMAAVMGDVTMTATEGFVTRYEDELDKADAVTLRAAAEATTKWQLSGLDPISTIHGDYRLDNLLFHPNGNQVVAVDWQTAALGPPLRDVAYFLGTSLTSEDRQHHEEQLVAAYHSAVLGRGVTDYSAERCWNDYRLGQLHGPMVTVIGCMYATATRSQLSDAMFLAMARRSCAAIRDLQSLELL
jgi:hypothetical protein